MNFLLSGVQDVRRRIRTQKSKLALAGERKELRLAEISLGREAWQVYQTDPELKESIAKLSEHLSNRESLIAKQAALEVRRTSISSKLAIELEASQKRLSELGVLRTPRIEELRSLHEQLNAKERERATLLKSIKTLEGEEARLDKSLIDLEATLPPPEDLESRKAAIGERRLLIPDEKAALIARETSFGADIEPLIGRRDALKKEVGDLDDKIRTEKNRFDAEERIARAQIRDLEAEIIAMRRAIAEIEAAQEDPLAEIGRWVAAREADDSFPEKKSSVRARREKVTQIEKHLQELRQQDADADPQELRKFYFVAVSLFTLVALSCALIFSSPQPREWLPSETNVIVSIRASQFAETDFAKRWQGVNPEAWGMMWGALVEPAKAIPGINLQVDVARITRAISERKENLGVYTLVELNTPVLPALDQLAASEGVIRKPVKGIDVLTSSDGQALAPVGPRTLAVGTTPEVENLVKVRLGFKPDLKLDEHFFGKFRRLQERSTFSLITRDPARLRDVVGPLLPARLLDAARLVGLALTVDSKVHATLIIRAPDSQTAAEVERLLVQSPAELLRLGDDELRLFEETPSVYRNSHEIETRFILPEPVAIQFFERLVRLDLPTETASRKVGHSQ